MSKALATDLRDAGIENVFVYVADAVRWDALPETIAARGAVSKTVAASIYSPTSFVSIVTGRYLPGHGVASFANRVPDDAFRLFDLAGYETRFRNTIGVAGGDDPIFRTLQCPPTDATDPFAELSEPFIVMERSQGGHAPYGGFEGTAKEYFAAREDASIEQLRTEYRRGVERDARAFERRLDALDDAGLRDSTLVIYTADHGELLGEGGLFGHTGVMRPELVYVPTVFVHPKIDARREEGIVRHVDLLPTILDVLGVDDSENADDTEKSEREGLDGTSVANKGEATAERGCSFYRVEHALGSLPLAPVSQYEGVWDASGGYIHTPSPLRERLVGLLGDITQGVERSLVRRHALSACLSYLSAEGIRGLPRFTPAEGRASLSAAKERGDSAGGSELDLTDDARERLHDMGYLI